MKLNNITDLIASLGRNIPFAETQPFDPAHYVYVVNQLIPEGKDAIIAGVKKYRAASDTGRNAELDSIDILLRILFRPFSTSCFEPNASVRWPLSNPLHMRNMPYFPIILLGDVPIHSISATYSPGGGVYDGRDEQVFLENVRQNGVLRNRLLKPSPEPLHIFNKILRSDQWYWSDNCGKPVSPHAHHLYRMCQNGARQDVMRQLLRMVRNVYPAVDKYTVSSSHDNNFEIITMSEWAKCFNHLEKLKLDWDIQRNRYQILLVCSP